MKKKLWLIPLFALALALVLVLCACNGESTDGGGTTDGGDGHVHSYSIKNVDDEYLKSPALGNDPAVYYYSCSCGEKGADTFTLPGGGQENNTGNGGDGHVYETWWTTDEEKHWRACIDVSCPSVSDKASHTFGAWTVDKAPTCTSAGTRHHDCTVCGKTVSESYDDPTVHTYATAWENDDTHHWHKCQNSGCTSVKDKTVHSMNWTVDKAATCHLSGLRHGTCTVCKQTATEAIPATASIVNGKCSACGGVATYTRDGDYIYFGEYPQTIKANSVTITTTQDSRGYYLGSDGYYYAKVTATPFEGWYEFSPGATISNGTVYYFKVEPIRWRILSENGDTALILCDSIIANHRYDDSSNNYANSEIRAWLNEQFYNTAFDSLQRELILTTTVNNSASTTGDKSSSNWMNNPYACADTNDKIFLLSGEEATNTAYGFSSDEDDYVVARRMIPSDYTLATGTIYDSCYGSGWWWLRSPYCYIDDYARLVTYDGCGGCDHVRITGNGVVPALQIRLR